jgi:hypothetical protein
LKARKRKAARMIRWTPPSCRVARPGSRVRALTTAVRVRRPIWVAPRPRTSGPSSQIEATAIAGIVSPMLAIAEP